MTIRNSTLKYLVLFVIPIIILFSCAEQYEIDGSGVLKGKISIGPLCPVERIPPDPDCLPTMETYKFWSIAAWTVNKKSKLATMDPALDGTYQIVLPTGNYSIDFEEDHSNTIGSNNLPTIISISNMDTTIFNVDIDTGIR